MMTTRTIAEIKRDYALEFFLSKRNDNTRMIAEVKRDDDHENDC